MSHHSRVPRLASRLPAAAHRHPTTRPKDCPPNLTHADRKPVILVVTEENLALHVKSLLVSQRYILYAAKDLNLAQKILENVAVDLVLLHYSAAMNDRQWVNYIQLQKWTTKPVLAIANITIPPSPGADQEAARAALVNEVNSYLNTVHLLCQTFVELLGKR